MRFAISIAALGFLHTSLVSAAHTLKLSNHCSYDLYFWAVGRWMLGKTENNDHYTVVPANGGSVIHDMIYTKDSGVSLKIRDRPYYVPAPKGILQVEYKWEPENNAIWYDLSAIDCDRYQGPDHPYWCPFLPGGVRMYIPDADPELCKIAQCMPGMDCENTYTTSGSWPEEPSWRCDDSYDILFETCVSTDAPQTLLDQGEDYTAVSVNQYQPPPDDDYYQSPPQPPYPQPSRPASDNDWHISPISRPSDDHSNWTPAHPAASDIYPPSPRSWPPPSKPPVNRNQMAQKGSQYPVPPNYPADTICWNAECTCYTGASSHTSNYPSDLSRDCPVDLHVPEYRRVARGQLGQRQDLAHAVNRNSAAAGVERY